MSKRRVVESFAPTGGRVLGIITLLIGLAVIVDIIVEWRSLEGLTAAAVVIALAALVWASMVRPSVVAYEEILVVRNFIRDVWIPWRLVQSTEVKPVLTINTTDGQAFRSVAVGATGADRRALWKAKARAMDGSSGNSAPGGPTAGVSTSSAGPAAPENVSSALRAAHRIEVMAEKYAGSAPEGGQVVRTWAWPEIAAFCVAAVIAALTVALL